jgi:hypothetical protein
VEERPAEQEADASGWLRGLPLDGLAVRVLIAADSSSLPILD